MDEPTAPPPAEGKQGADAPRSPTALIFWVTLAAVAFAAGGMVYAGGKARDVALAGGGALPFAALAALAYAGDRHGWPKLFAGLLWLALAAGVGAAAVLLAVAGRLDPEAARPVLAAGGATDIAWKTGPWGVLQPGGVRTFRLAVGGALVVGLLATACFLPSVRRSAARLLPVETDAYVHATALAAVVLLTLAGLMPLVLVGSPPLLTLAAALPDEQLRDLASPAAQVPPMLISLAWLAPAALVAVGWPVERSFAAACERLGVVVPAWWHVPLAVALAAALVPVSWGLDLVIAAAWRALGWPTTDAKAFEQLIAFAMTSPGMALLVGLYAGVSEEVVFRGVLQPRLGLVASNLCFAAVHAAQYHFDGLLGVFLLGLVLGVVRHVTNTTTSALVHGLLDAFLLMTTPVAGGG